MTRADLVVALGVLDDKAHLRLARVVQRMRELAADTPRAGKKLQIANKGRILHMRESWLEVLGWWGAHII